MKTALKILSLVLLLAGYAEAAILNLAWQDNSGNETGFEIERCQGASCTSFALIAKVGVDVRTYADTTLADSTTYCYRVRAVNAGGASAYTNIACNTTPTPLPPVPQAPTNLVVTPVP